MVIRFGEIEYSPISFGKAESRVRRWERIYSEDQVRFLVKEALRVTRSPGKATAYQAWLDAHPGEEGLDV